MISLCRDGLPSFFCPTSSKLCQYSESSLPDAMVCISAVSRSPCLGACNANTSKFSFAASSTSQSGSSFPSQNIFCRDTIASLIVFYCCHHAVGHGTCFYASPGTEFPWSSTVQLPREGHATWTLCLHSIILPISPSFMRMFPRLDFTQSITSLMYQICACQFYRKNVFASFY